MKTSRLFVFAAAATLALASCEKSAETPAPTPEPTPAPAPAPAPEPAEPIVLDTRGAAKVAADNAFAFDLFRQTVATADEKDNLFVSPLSLTMLLGMVYNGASPDAAAEMAEALGVGDLSAEQVNEHYRTLVTALLAADPTTAVAIANSIWMRQGFDAKQPFIDANQNYYSAQVRTRDFALGATVDEINRWCADNTNNKIPKILDAISPSAVMYLINAVYFKGQWKYTFDEADTRDDDFTLADGSVRRVKMMSQTTDLGFYRDAAMRAVDLPYGNGAFAMTVVMPEQGSVDELIDRLDAAMYDELVAGMGTMGLELKLPRWKQECEFSLNDAVQNLGIAQIFGPGALSGISDDDGLAVSSIRQKTFVEVNEKGTEAAAVTIGDVVTTADPGDGPPSFVADSPFVYLIRERSTGAILFIGRMDNPEEN